MSVQILTPNLQLVSGSPIIICQSTKIELFQTSSKIARTHNVNPGYNGPSNTWWSYYWNSPEQNTTVGVQVLRNTCI